jgi:hypothetical protein
MILMTDFFLGIANRLAPQVQITFLGMPLKSLLALTIVFFGWTLFTEEIVVQAYKALNDVTGLIPLFQTEWVVASIFVLKRLTRKPVLSKKLKTECEDSRPAHQFVTCVAPGFLDNATSFPLLSWIDS